MMIYLVYLGASVGVKYGNHIAVEFLSTMLPKKGQDILEVLVDLLMLLCFAVIIYYGFKVVNVTMMQKSPAMQLKMGYIYFSLVLGGGLMFLQGTIDLIKTIARIAGKERVSNERSPVT